MVGYVAAELKITEPLKIGFDLSYVAGDNNYAYLDVAKSLIWLQMLRVLNSLN